jgi:hypothetical protein
VKIVVTILFKDDVQTVHFVQIEMKNVICSCLALSLKD